MALLTRFGIIEDTIKNFGDVAGQHRPSKILGVGLNVGSSTMQVIVAHLISKRSQNDAKRLGQADFIKQLAVAAHDNFDHIVILGDMNDLPDSPPLKRLRGTDDDNPDNDYIQTAVTTGPSPAFSYTFENQRQLIDHILLSPSLRPAFDASSTDQSHRSIDLGPISDHRAVLVKFELN